MYYEILLFTIGFLLLYAGGEMFIKGSVGISYIFRIKPLIIAATIAAFGTSSPELFVSLTAAIADHNELAIGNIVGSCIANIGLILGICALINPIVVKKSLLKKEIPMLIAVSFLIFFMSADLYLSRAEAAVLLFCFCLFIIYCIKSAKDEGVSGDIYKKYSKIKSFFMTIISIPVLILGSSFLVKAATAISVKAGISELTMGLTIVAFGTSLPELSVSAVASFRKEHDISIGNIVGSNLFNILLILGCLYLIKPAFLNINTLKFDMPVMVAYTVLLLPMLKTGFRLSRREGFLFLVSYLFYVFILFKRNML